MHIELIWNSVQVVKKVAQDDEIRAYIVKRLHFLPVLVDILVVTKNNKRKGLMQFINELSLKHKVKGTDDFVGKLFATLISIITSDENDENHVSA